MTTPSRLALVAAIVAKDLRSFLRDRTWIVLTPVSVAFVAAAFWLAPATVDDTLYVGVFPAESIALIRDVTEEDGEENGVLYVGFEDEARLVGAIAGELEDPTEDEDKVVMGLAFPRDFDDALARGERPEVTLHVDARLPPQLRDAMASETREVAWMMRSALQGREAGADWPVTLDAENSVLGEDRAHDPVPMREKLRPMLAVLILMLGSIAMAGLVAVEIEKRTVTAMLTTPVRKGDFLLAKGITGTLLGLSQVLFLLLITWSVGPHLWLIVLLLTLGAGMMAAMGMIAGAAGREFMTTMFLSIALIVPMAAPTFAVLFPGSHSLSVKVMPSYGFTEALVQLMGYGRGPEELIGYIGMTVAWTAGLFLVALWLLDRRLGAL